MSSTSTAHKSVVESAAARAYENKNPGKSWNHAPAWQRDHFRLVERQRAGVADDE